MKMPAAHPGAGEMEPQAHLLTSPSGAGFSLPDAQMSPVAPSRRTDTRRPAFYGSAIRPVLMTNLVPWRTSGSVHPSPFCPWQKVCLKEAWTEVPPRPGGSKSGLSFALSTERPQAGGLGPRRVPFPSHLLLLWCKGRPRWPPTSYNKVKDYFSSESVFMKINMS